MGKAIQLLVGLGNPGKQYQSTRHNAGECLVSTFAQQHQLELREESKFQGKFGQFTLDQKNIKLLLPTTYMNRSGISIKKTAQFYKIPVDQILVVHDELDLAPGIIRFKSGGGHGGHNGLKDIINQFGQDRNFQRLRIGIGHPGKSSEVLNFVLKTPSESEQHLIEQAIEAGLKHLEQLLSGAFESAMNSLHRFSAN